MLSCENRPRIITLTRQKEDEWPDGYIKRVVETLRNNNVASAVVGLPSSYESNHVLVIFPSGATCLDQGSEELFSEFCERIGEIVQSNGGSGNFFVYDKVRGSEPRAIVI